MAGFATTSASSGVQRMAEGWSIVRPERATGSPASGVGAPGAAPARTVRAD
ncbi:hypothetical protein WMF11_31960 [Sorangium sp. So ce295]|uniref:hypothetical protein n=1 Tax=Sorangium sp. So ce295 TaxID=3133295 RepID=UPI003F61F2B6